MKYSSGAAITLLFLLLVPPGLARSGEPNTSAIWQLPQLADLIQEGLVNNKELQGLAARASSFRANVPAAGSLDDPRLGFGLLNLPTDSFELDQEAMTQKQIFVAQRLPWLGKLDLREQKAALIARQQEVLLTAKQLELSRQIADSYFELLYLEKALQTNDKLRLKIEQILKIAETAYAAGRGRQQDVLQGQLELSRLLNERIELAQQRSSQIYRLNELLNRAPETPIAIDPDYRLVPAPPDGAMLLDTILAHNPALRVKELEQQTASLDSRLAEKDYWPDVDLMLAYGQRDPSPDGMERSDFLSATISMNIPLWQHSRQDNLLDAARKRQSASQRAYENLADTLPHRAKRLLTALNANLESLRLYRHGLLLQADHTARATMAAYEVGKAEFSTLLTSQLRLLEFELKARRYEIQACKNLAELAELAGIPPQGGRT